MPITAAEWDEAAIDPEEGHPETTPVGDHETEKDLIVAFLSENHESAFTRSEIVRGVHFGESTPAETISERLLNLPDQLVDVAGDLVASGMVVDEISEALDELLADGVVDRREVARDGGEPVVYYRLAE